jgi:outer membrane protein TolC
MDFRACRPWLVVTAALVLSLSPAGCRTPRDYRVEVDHKIRDIVMEEQARVLGKQGDFCIEGPADSLRRLLIEQAALPTAGPASLGTDKLSPLPHWPEARGPDPSRAATDPFLPLDTPLVLSLLKALEIGALNSPGFMAKKEAVFQAALALFLEQEDFRNSLVGRIQYLVRSDTSQTPSRKGTLGTGTLTGTRKSDNGTTLTADLALDLATLLSAGGGSSFGIAGDASLSIPLLRGSGRHIVTEPMHQAQQNLVYAILEFEQFKKQFAVAVGRDYLGILKQLDSVENAREDYRTRMVSAQRSRRLADAGRLKEIEVDQSVQTELVARLRWVSAREQVKRQMDAFKHLLGLPPDADISIDSDELKRIPQLGGIAGPLELSGRKAVELALANRLDIRVALGRVFDAQRAVITAADALGAELTFLGSASLGERRTITTADLENARLQMDKGVFSALLTLDLPFERTAEAVTYRNSFILLEQAVRDLQILEDTLKIEVRSRLRELLEARETLNIQSRAVSLAQKRVKSISLFMDAGRAETRDLLEAQDALLSARNGFTSARVNYRIAELEIQRDMGVLTVTDTGLWQEYTPEAKFRETTLDDEK